MPTDEKHTIWGTTTDSYGRMVKELYFLLKSVNEDRPLRGKDIVNDKYSKDDKCSKDCKYIAVRKENSIYYVLGPIIREKMKFSAELQQIVVSIDNNLADVRVSKNDLVFRNLVVGYEILLFPGTKFYINANAIEKLEALINAKRDKKTK